MPTGYLLVRHASRVQFFKQGWKAHCHLNYTNHVIFSHQTQKHGITYIDIIARATVTASIVMCVHTM